MADENTLLWSAFRLGIGLCCVYDLLRIGRRVCPGGRVRVALEDLVYWGWVSMRVFLLLYRESDGTLRWFAVLGAAAGMALYHYLIGRRLVRLAKKYHNKCYEILDGAARKRYNVNIQSLHGAGKESADDRQEERVPQETSEQVQHGAGSRGRAAGDGGGRREHRGDE